MDCNKIQELFTSYVDGDLDNSIVTLFDDHLDNCANCKVEWSFFNKTVHYLAAMEKLTAPSDLLMGIHEKMERQNQGLFSRLWQGWQNVDMSMSWQTGTAIIAIAFSAMAIIKTFPLQDPGQGAAPQTQIAQTQQKANGIQPNRKIFRLPSESFFAGDSPRFTETSPRLSYATNRAGAGSLSGQGPSQSLYEVFTRIHSIPDNGLTKLYRPDMAVSTETLSFARKNSLYKQITADTGWHSETHDDELLIFVRPKQLPRLQQLFARHKIVFPPTDFSLTDFNPHKRTVTIAVQL
jgi:hypothetical protein